MIEGRHFAARQSQGDRDYQEDNWGYFSRLDPEDDTPEGLMVVLSDGMGGHKGGAHASAIAVDAFLEFYRAGDAPPMETLRAALEDGNARIGDDGAANEELEGMGCTVVAVDISADGVRWVSVGDSPMWLLREGKLRRLNEDHSMAPLLQMQVDAGEMTEEDAAHHPQRNALRSAMVGDELSLIDESETAVAFKPGDRLIIASDGLETLSEEEIRTIAARDPSATSEAIATELVAAVDKKHRRGQDNTTVVVITPYDAVAAKDAMFGRTLVPMLLIAMLLAGGAAGGLYVFGNPFADDGGVSATSATAGSGAAGATGGGSSEAATGAAGGTGAPAGVTRKEAEKNAAGSGSTAGAVTGGEAGDTAAREGAANVRKIPPGSAGTSSGQTAGATPGEVVNPKASKSKTKKKPTQGDQTTVGQ